VRRSILNRLAGVSPTTPYSCDIECQDQSRIAVEVHENLICDSRGVVTGMRSALLDITAAKGRVLATMSHELRTPLNGIIGLSELIFDGAAGPVSEEQQEYLGDVLASSKHLLQLVNDVLDLAKMESGKINFIPERVKIEPLLREVCDVLRILADEKGISVGLDTGDLDTVLTDPARLKQVVYNYLFNAIKSAPCGGVVHVRASWEGDGAFRLEVEDSGPGFEEADISRLFADFPRVEEPRTRVSTGLGLAVTKRIVESQGGAVGARSRPGKGSIFYAILPVEFAESGSTLAASIEPEIEGRRTDLPQETMPV
jgi:signal transduction histidine kinase